MGVIYKLRPEVKDFILEKKRNEPNFSCRKLPALVLDKFQIKLSKSSIATIIKQSGMSSSVGRRRKIRRKDEALGLGVYFLKAMDALSGGSAKLAELLKNNLKSESTELFEKTEFLIYSNLFGSIGDLALNKESGIWTLINRKLSSVSLSFFLSELQRIKNLGPLASAIFLSSYQEVRCVKIEADGKFICFLDGKMHVAWSSSRIPQDFSSVLFNLENYFDDHFSKNSPLVLFMSPGYDKPTDEFLNLLLTLNLNNNKEIKLIFLDLEFKEIKSKIYQLKKKTSLIFGLWPWQFSQYRLEKTESTFERINLKGVHKEYYIAPSSMELTVPRGAETISIKLSGCSLKQSLEDKVKLYILSNDSSIGDNWKNIALTYLTRWPNIQETLQDFGRKVEASGDTNNQKTIKPKEKENKASLDIYKAINSYIYQLSKQFGHYFLPSAYKDVDFDTLKKRFFDLPGEVKQQSGVITITLRAATGYAFLKDLEYACNRLNEAEISLPDSNRLWFKFKLENE